jgi:hypothetical protein
LLARCTGRCAGKPREESELPGACKVVPLLVVPAVVAADWAYWRTRLPSLGAWIAAGVAAGFGPMLAISPDAVVDFFRYHGGRGLQVESTLGLLLGAARWVAGAAVPSSFSFGSFNLDGPVADALARLTLPLTVMAAGAVAVLAGRADARDGDRARIERVACAALAATIVLWLGGKVFSPQYLTWGLPLVIAIPGSRGLRAGALALLALTLTQVYHRGFYSLLTEQRFVGLFTVLARDAALVALLAVAAGAMVRASRDTPARSSAP